MSFFARTSQLRKSLASVTNHVTIMITNLWTAQHRDYQIDNEISYDPDRLDDVTDCERQLSRRQHAYRLARLPNYCSSVLRAFDWSRRDEHQSRMSVTPRRS